MDLIIDRAAGLDVHQAPGRGVPSNRESAGKAKPSRTRQGNPHLKMALVQRGAQEGSYDKHSPTS